MHLSNVLLVLSAAVAASAMTTGFAMRDAHHRHAAVAREAEPAPAPAPSVQVVRRRRSGKRCSPSSIGSNAPSVSAPSSSAQPTATVAPANPGDKPPVFSSSATEEHTTATPQPPQETKTSEEPPKATSSQAPPPAKTSSQDAPTPTPTSTGGGSSGGDGQSHSGDGTFYATGLGSCGIVNQDTDFIAAVSHLLYDTFPGYTGGNPNNNPICNKKVTAHYQGKEVTVTITDRCTACAIDDLDFSPAAFNELSDPSVGRIHNMVWNFI